MNGELQVAVIAEEPELSTPTHQCDHCHKAFVLGALETRVVDPADRYAQYGATAAGFVGFVVPGVGNIVGVLAGGALGWLVGKVSGVSHYSGYVCDHCGEMNAGCAAPYCHRRAELEASIERDVANLARVRAAGDQTACRWFEARIRTDTECLATRNWEEG